MDYRSHTIIIQLLHPAFVLQCHASKHSVKTQQPGVNSVYKLPHIMASLASTLQPCNPGTVDTPSAGFASDVLKADSKDVEMNSVFSMSFTSHFWLVMAKKIKWPLGYTETHHFMKIAIKWQ